MGGSTFIQVWKVLPEYYEQFSMWGVPNICTARTLWICFKQDLISILSLNLIKFEETSIEKLSTHTVNHTTITVIITRTLSYLVLLFWLAGRLACWLAVADWLRLAGWLSLALRQLFSGVGSAGNWGIFLPYHIFIAQTDQSEAIIFNVHAGQSEARIVNGKIVASDWSASV